MHLSPRFSTLLRVEFSLHHLRRTVTFSAVTACLLSAVASLYGAAPSLDHLYPAGGQQGTSVTVTANGKFEPWPVEAWTDSPGLVFKADKDKGKFQVTVGKDVTAGPHLVRVYNADGASVPRFFLVSRHPEVEEKEKNNGSSEAQSVELPAIVNGKLERNNDVDCFAMKLQAGQWLIASVNAFTIYSTMDGLLRLTDTNGVKLAFAHDSDTLDPFLAWQAKTNGTYVVQVMGFAHPATASENLGGGPNYIYRLSLTTGPYVHYTIPSVAQRGKKRDLQLVGWNFAKGSRAMAYPLEAASDKRDEMLLNIQDIFNSVKIPLSDSGAFTESEPNDTAEKAQKIILPCSIDGILQSAGDQDRYVFEAKKDGRFEFDIETVSPGAPLDGWLRIVDHTGKELAKTGERSSGRRRGGDSSDSSKLAWTAPADGAYSLIVGNLLHRGDSNHVYRVDITPNQPSFTAKASTHTFSVTPGKTNDLKATVRFNNGFNEKLKLSARDLPKGVTAESVEVGEKGGDVTLKLVAASDAPPHNGPVRLVVTDAKGNNEQLVPADLTSGGIDNGVPQGFPTLVMDQTEALWLTVLPKPAPKEEKPKEETKK